MTRKSKKGGKPAEASTTVANAAAPPNPAGEMPVTDGVGTNTSSRSRSRPNPRNERRGGTGGRGNTDPGNTGKTSSYSVVGSVGEMAGNQSIIAGSPVVHKTGWSGARFSSFMKTDRQRAMPTVLYLEYGRTNWDTFKTGAVVDLGADTLAASMPLFFNKMMARVNMEKRFLPQPVLSTPGDFTAWLNDYTAAYLGLRGVEGMLAAGGFNLGTEVVVSAITGGGNLERLRYDLGRLATIPCPPGLRELLDPLCGSYCLGPTNAVVQASFSLGSSSASITDIATIAGIGNLLSAAETQLGLAEGVGPESTNVIQLMAYLYGVPAALPQKQVYNEPELLDLHRCAIGAVRDTTAALTYSSPISNGPNGPIPLLVSRGKENPQLLSYLRPQFFQLDTTVGNAAPSYAGLLNFPTNAGSYVRFISSVGVSAVDILQSTTAGVPDITNVTDKSAGEFIWAPLSTRAALALPANDSFDYQQHDIVYAFNEQLATETQSILDRVFLGGLKVASSTASK